MTGSTQPGAVLFKVVEPHIALVTINRPEARNAVNGAVAAGLEEAVERIENDPDLWAAILTGAGPHAFCAGADLKEVSTGRGVTLSTPKGGFAGFVRANRTKLWIAAAQGHALAGGLELLLSCDLAVAADTANFGLPEVKRSLVAGAGGLFRLPRAVPKAIALEMIATGDSIPAARAAQFGLINAVVPATDVLQAALVLARRVTVNAPVAVRESLGVARQAYDRTDAELWDISAAAGGRVWNTEDFKEGPRAFVEKRPPRWGADDKPQEGTTMPDTYKHILYTVEDRIARLTLNAPEKRNALSFPMRDEIVQALRWAESDDDVSIVLIDGAGPSFCSGYDMSAGHRRAQQGRLGPVTKLRRLDRSICPQLPT